MFSRSAISSLRISHPLLTTSRRHSSTALISALEESIESKRARLSYLKKNHASDPIGQASTVGAVIGGARGLTTLLWEGSSLDKNEGIRFHGLSLPELLPKLSEPQPESMFFYLLTGKVPTEEEAREFSQDLVARSSLGEEVEKVIDASSLPRTLHPMAQLQIGTTLLSEKSKFTELYSSEEGLLKTEYWRSTLDDSLDLVAKLPNLSARIFRNVYYKNSELPLIAAGQGDLIGNFSTQLSALIPIKTESRAAFEKYLKLYITLHSDHEGGNVSAHACHLVGSALSNPFQSYAAALAGLAGPLHGLANQEVLKFLLEMQGYYSKVGIEDPSDAQLKAYLWRHLKLGKVIPGYGHAVLRRPDPRFKALEDFILASPNSFGNSKLINLILALSRVVPEVLTQHGKTANPFPNVDSISGGVLYHLGMKEMEAYTVVFGVSRAMGCVSQLVWDRALGLPIERPKSISIGGMEAMVGKGGEKWWKDMTA
ncbi:2-methylcitrate synthase mitochondrial precursor [Mrakia frigida]|uniref:2-methylcitrate synthase mitochondrial precursor n=1 Tax=Mrakia frigida TaxID=29902 RepID=UPI003FCC0E47